MEGRVLKSDGYVQYIELSSHYEGGSFWFEGQQVIAVFEDDHVGLHRLIDGHHVESAAQFELTTDEMNTLIQHYTAFLASREQTLHDERRPIGQLDDYPF